MKEVLMLDNIFSTLVCLRQTKRFGKISYLLLKLLGVEIPVEVVIGKEVRFPHWAYGLVIHQDTVIEDNVSLYQGVTIGRADIYRDISQSSFAGVRICEGAVIGAGAKILCSEGELIVGKQSVIGANSVLLESKGESEIWAGIPAKKIGMRDVGASED